MKYLNPKLSDGFSLGQSTSDLISFYGVTPIAQSSGAAQAAVGTTPATSSTPVGYTTTTQANAIVALVNEIRRVLVAYGLMKGAA